MSPINAQVALGGTATFTVIASDSDTGDNITVTLMRGGSVVANGVFIGANTYTLSYAPPTGVTNDALTVVVTDHVGITTQQAVTVTAVAAPSSAAPSPDVVIPASYPTPQIGTIAGTFEASTAVLRATRFRSRSLPAPMAGSPASRSRTTAKEGMECSASAGRSPGFRRLRAARKRRRRTRRIPVSATRPITVLTKKRRTLSAFDGQRLVPIAITAVVDDWYGTNTSAIQTEYRTEGESYSRIISFQYDFTDPNNSASPIISPYRWTVYQKSGQILDYGSHWWILTAGFEQAAYGRVSVAKQWVLDRVQDRSGNFIEIDYADRNGSASQNVVEILRACGTASGHGQNGLDSPTLPQPVGAYPNVEFWPTVIRSYAAGAKGEQCVVSTTNLTRDNSSPNNQVRVVYDDHDPKQGTAATRDLTTTRVLARLRCRSA